MRKLFASIAVLVAVLVAGVVGPSSFATAAPAVSLVSWPQNVVYVYDTTAAVKKADGTQTWPVKAAAARWSKGNPVDIRYTSTGCPANVQCVTIRQSELADPTVGLTTTTTGGGVIKTSNVTLDTTFGRKNSAARRQNVVCHEMGHALGLKHQATTSSCMNSYVTSERYPNATDIKNLKTMYGSR